MFYVSNRESIGAVCNSRCAFHNGYIHFIICYIQLCSACLSPKEHGSRGQRLDLSCSIFSRNFLWRSFSLTKFGVPLKAPKIVGLKNNSLLKTSKVLDSTTLKDRKPGRQEPKKKILHPRIPIAWWSLKQKAELISKFGLQARSYTVAIKILMPIWSLTTVLLYEIQYFILQLYKQSLKSWLAMLQLSRCTLWLIPLVCTSPINENATTEYQLTQGVHASPSSQMNWLIPLSSTLPKGRITSQLANVLRISGCMDSALNGTSLSLLPPLWFIEYHRKECKNQRTRISAVNTVFWVWHD